MRVDASIGTALRRTPQSKRKEVQMQLGKRFEGESYNTLKGRVYNWRLLFDASIAMGVKIG